MQLARHLLIKLSAIGIKSLTQLQSTNLITIFLQLKDTFPALSNKILFNLYCLSNNLEINQLNSETKYNLLLALKNHSPVYKPLTQGTIAYFSTQVLQIAQLATSEVPVGALIIKNEQIVGQGYNQINPHNPYDSSHAEIIALANAQQNLATKYLGDCDLYLSLEPCLMCSGAIINARIKRVIFISQEHKTGAAISQYQVFSNSKFNHHTQVIGPLDQRGGLLLQQYFMQKRKKINKINSI